MYSLSNAPAVSFRTILEQHKSIILFFFSFLLVYYVVLSLMLGDGFVSIETSLDEWSKKQVNGNEPTEWKIKKISAGIWEM